MQKKKRIDGEESSEHMKYRVHLQAIWHIICRNLLTRVLCHCLDEVIKLQKWMEVQKKRRKQHQTCYIKPCLQHDWVAAGHPIFQWQKDAAKKLFQEVKITRHNQHKLAMIQNWCKYTLNKSGAVDLSSGSLKDKRIKVPDKTLENWVFICRKFPNTFGGDIS